MSYIHYCDTWLVSKCANIIEDLLDVIVAETLWKTHRGVFLLVLK